MSMHVKQMDGYKGGSCCVGSARKKRLYALLSQGWTDKATDVITSQYVLGRKASCMATSKIIATGHLMIIFVD